MKEREVEDENKGKEEEKKKSRKEEQEEEEEEKKKERRRRRRKERKRRRRWRTRGGKLAVWCCAYWCVYVLMFQLTQGHRIANRPERPDQLQLTQLGEI